MSSLAEINQAFPYFFPTVVFLFGACVGSFLNVCIYRIPAGKSIVSPPSHCACGKPIAWYDNIPILGWFLLRGRARCCGRRISFRYPLVEILTAAVFCRMFVAHEPAVAFAGMLFAALMIFCAFVDIDTMTLPDFATVGGTAAGVALSVLIPQLHSAEIEGAPFLASAVASATSAVCGIAVGSGLLYWVRLGGEVVFRREAMGEGDVILIGAIGAFCGWQGALFAIFAGSLIGAIVMLPLCAIKILFSKKSEPRKSGKGKKRSGNKEGEGDEDGGEEFAPDAIPYGPWLALGGLLYYMFFSDWVCAYFDAVGALLFA